jgi:hypothetical protein
MQRVQLFPIRRVSLYKPPQGGGKFKELRTDEPASKIWRYVLRKQRAPLGALFRCRQGGSRNHGTSDRSRRRLPESDRCKRLCRWVFGRRYPLVQAVPRNRATVCATVTREWSPANT